MCKVLKVNRSRCYRWFSHDPSNRGIENSLFTELIKDIFEISNQTYGSPRITEELKRDGHRTSKLLCTK